ncbi:hypothetical protein P3T76_014927 [Phytophthora citrophthora]|uniref:M96 mating-specific protein family n=1 Tax=Phytophthora citrophthora TaxID=4793 RepID=A0AAD9LBU1_9STRA|nr:hypothetical protein P3T76_014927 [Phytophthora citrophthora]
MQPAKPKRVRRQKLELEYLRKLVPSLEEKVLELNVKQTAVVDYARSIESSEIPSIWKGMAERQLKERTRVEDKNKELRTSLEGQIKLAKKLESLLRKRQRNEEAEVLLDTNSAVPTPLSPTDEEIFADQLAHVQQAHLVLDQVFCGPEFAAQAPFHDFQVTNDSGSSSGVAFVKKAKSVIPFDLQVAEKAFWRTFVKEGTGRDSFFYFDERLSTENLVAASYGRYFQAGNFHAKVLGMQTYRKCIVGGKILICWKWVVNPVEVNGSKFRGIRCHESGWIVLRSVNVGNAANTFPMDSEFCNAVTSTELQSYSKMTIELQEDVVNQELQVGTLTSFVVGMHDTVTEACGKIISKMLVEEDWNLNGWIDTMAF